MAYNFIRVDKNKLVTIIIYQFSKTKYSTYVADKTVLQVVLDCFSSLHSLNNVFQLG